MGLTPTRRPLSGVWKRRINSFCGARFRCYKSENVAAGKWDGRVIAIWKFGNTYEIARL